jgi:hypothetical protein
MLKKRSKQVKIKKDFSNDIGFISKFFVAGHFFRKEFLHFVNVENIICKS